MTHVMLRALDSTDIPLTGERRVIREWDCETFYVSRGPRPSIYIVRNRTAFCCGMSRVAVGINDVQSLISKI